MENKFKVGDRVVVQSDQYYNRHVGAIGTIQLSHGDAFNVVIDNQDKEFLWHFHYDQITHYGQTLANLNVKAGDVVECVKKGADVYGYPKDMTKTIDECGLWFGMGAVLCRGLFRIISRASDTPNWQICEPDYIEQVNHVCAYHMGVPVSWREIVAKEVDVEMKAHINKAGGYDGWHINAGHGNSTNATLRGKTLNGKPVGQWVIDMDVV